LVKNGQHLKNSFGFSASYMQDAQNQGFDTSPAEIGPELTKHFRGLRVWLPLRIYGLAPFVAGLREKIMLTQYFREEINKRGFETPYDPELTVLLFRMVKGYLEESNANNSTLQKALQADGLIFISSTNVDGLQDMEYTSTFLPKQQRFLP
jgi:aromatic-L-amino-acid decarboxylase